MGKFNLKSYFTFLSRNKAYTAVNVFGLAVSLTFVIIIGLYTWQEFSIDHQHSKAKRIHVAGVQHRPPAQQGKAHLQRRTDGFRQYPHSQLPPYSPKIPARQVS